MAREDSGPYHLSILCTCCLSFSPLTKVHPPARDHPRCLLNTTTQNPLENRLVQIQAPVYHCYNEHKSQKLHCHYNFLPGWNKGGVVQDYKLKILGSSVRRVCESLLPGLAKSVNQQVRSETWYGQWVLTGSIWLYLTFYGIPDTVLKRKDRQALGKIVCYYLHWKSLPVSIPKANAIWHAWRSKWQGGVKWKTWPAFLHVKRGLQWEPSWSQWNCK